MTDHRRAMILAAGFGKRLRPLSEHLPKPLIPLAGKPLLAEILDRLRLAGIVEFCINAHHQSEKIEAFIQSYGQKNEMSESLVFSPEEKILGTGGGLIQAADFLRQGDEFLLHNGDVLTDINVQDLIKTHRRNNALVTLALIDWPEVNSLLLDENGVVVDVASRLGTQISGQFCELTYSGVAMIDSRFLDYLPVEGPSSLVDGFLTAISRKPGSICGWAPDPVNWNDLGTLKRYVTVQEKYLRNLSSKQDTNTKTVGFPNGSPMLSRLQVATDDRPVRLAEQGSDRAFWRVRTPDKSVVLMRTSPHDLEFERYIAVGGFLFENKLGGPEIFDLDLESRALLMEDLGDSTLYRQVVQHGNNPEPLYREVIRLLVELQTRGSRKRDCCPLCHDRIFDHKMLRWETEYFRHNFLQQWCGLPATELAVLDEEFELLAQTVIQQPQVLMHRDFQSQNIHFCPEGVRLVDFQGMRWGPVTYDLMSLLKDCYVPLDIDLRESLVEYYRLCLQKNGGPDFSPKTMQKYSTAAGLQRNMQALGAFSYLTRVKGRRGFDLYMPQGLLLLREGLADFKDMPSLENLLTGIQLQP